MQLVHRCPVAAEDLCQEVVREPGVELWRTHVRKRVDSHVPRGGNELRALISIRAEHDCDVCQYAARLDGLCWFQRQLDTINDWGWHENQSF